MGSGFRTNVTYIQLKTHEKTYTPYRYGTTVLPDAGYDAMTKVHLNDVPKTIVANAYGNTVYIGTQNPT